MPQLSPTSNSHFFSPSGSVTESQTSHRDAAVVKAGSSCWIPLKESTLGLKYPQLNGASETPHGEWGCDGGAGLCMLKPDDSGRCSILLLKNAQGTHDEGLWSVPGGAIERIAHTNKPEDPLHCALRETLEEVYRLPNGQVWTNPIVLRNTHTGFTYRLFLCLLPTNSQWNPSIRAEHNAYSWQALEQAAHTSELHPGVQCALDYMAQQWATAIQNQPLSFAVNATPNTNPLYITEAQFALRNLETPVSSSVEASLAQALPSETRALIEHAEAPTRVWLSQHPNQLPPGWDQDTIDKLPVSIPEIIRIEDEHSKSHVVAYHAFADSLLPGHWTGEVLMKALCEHESAGIRENLNHLSWHRNPFEINKNRGRDVHNLMEHTTNHPSRDNGDVGRFSLLSCNPSLFQNTDVDAMESTADYLHDAINVAPPNLKEWISGMLHTRFPACENARINKASDDILHLCTQASNALPTTKKASVLMQVLIPHALVNKLAYISASNGIPDSANPDTLNTLVKLKTPHTNQEVSNARSLQIRLLASTLQDPKVAPHLKVNLFSRYTSSQQGAIKSRINDIIQGLHSDS